MIASWVPRAVVALVLLEYGETEAYTAAYSMRVSGGPYHLVGTSVTRPAASPGVMASLYYTRGAVGSLLSKTGDTLDEEDIEGTMQRLTRILEQDLPLQYNKPQDLSIFGDNVEFQDPVTTLRGKLPYRGMLFFTLLFFRVACKPGSSYFHVTAIDRPTRQTIRTVWETGAVTLNGRDLFISGVDTFTVGEDGRISRHDSAWDQTWEEVRGQVA